jgi:type II secretory pathway pseudopilin PulG
MYYCEVEEKKRSHRKFGSEEKMNRVAAFTLIELLIMIAIISIIAAILAPVYASAIRDSRRAVSISNMRQCGMALSLYCNDYDGYRSMPNANEAVTVLAQMPTCDPNDTWRKQGCTEVYGAPLIGSYGYVRADPGYTSDAGWQAALNSSFHVAVLASIYYASNVPAPFVGNTPYFESAACADNTRCELPDCVLKLYLDGSVKFSKEPRGTNGATILMSWNEIFMLPDSALTKQD